MSFLKRVAEATVQSTEDLGEVVDRSSNKRLRQAAEQTETTMNLYQRLPSSVLKTTTGGLPLVTSQFAENYVSNLLKDTVRKQQDKLLKNAKRSSAILSSAIEGVIENRLRDKPCALANPPTADVVMQRILKKKTARRTKLNAKDKRKLQLHMVGKNLLFSAFLPLHRLWLEYIRDILHQQTQPSAFLPRLLKADYHGAFISVSKSKACATHVGKSGIVVKETENMFYLVTEQNLLKKIPKRHTVFEFRLPFSHSEAVQIFGDQICFRPSERVAKKFKNKPSIDL